MQPFSFPPPENDCPEDLLFKGSFPFHKDGLKNLFFIFLNVLNLDKVKVVRVHVKR